MKVNILVVLIALILIVFMYHALMCAYTIELLEKED